MYIPKPHINHQSLGLYIHIPFCMSKCPYCDFNSYATTKEELGTKEERYVDALIKELESQVLELGLDKKILSSIFFGGGTPSYFSSKSIQTILAAAYSKFELAPELEVTLEANPMSFKEDLFLEKFRSFRESGINRLSFGAQSVRRDKLEFLGRWHEPEDVLSSVSKARECGFTNISCDFISATKLDSKRSFLEELEQAVKLKTNHLSAYLLTIEPGTKFGVQTRKGAEFTCSEEEASEIYTATQDYLESTGYTQYEISNYAKQGEECAHNLLYWRGGEYLGLGAGAHSHILENGKSKRWANTPSPDIYVSRIKEEGQAEQVVDLYKAGASESEMLLLRLRLREGLVLSENSAFEKAYQQGKFDYLLREGFLKVEGTRVFIPREKFILADSVIGEVSAIL